MKKILIVFLIIFIILFILSIMKKQPEGMNFESKNYKKVSVEFFRDLTYEKNGKTAVEQEIFNEVYKIIDSSEKFLIIDMFLFNDNYRNPEKFVNLADELTERIIKRKKEKPSLKILFITDPINTFYGSYNNIYIEKMKENNIDVVMTDLDKLSNSNPLYSTFWDNGIKYFYKKKLDKKGWLKNPFGDPENKVYLSSYFKLLNFKANHRKTIISEKYAAVLSANPHGASCYHSNIGFKFRGDLIKDLLSTELNVLKFSDYILYDEYKTCLNLVENSKFIDSKIEGKVITEGKIKKNLLDVVKDLKKGDELKIATFYLSELEIINSIKNASNRGVKVRIILDPSKDAFGVDKKGIPNIYMARKILKNTNIKIKWYETNGEQFHSKLVIANNKEKTYIIGGSANLTRRNIGNYNLETNLILKMPIGNKFSIKVNNYFDNIFNNKKGNFVVEYSKYEDKSLIKEIFSTFQEKTGLGTF